METKEKLLVAARKEFLAKGYERASLRVMSKDEGFTAGLIYSYLQHKDDLFKTVVGKVNVPKIIDVDNYPVAFAMIVERENTDNNYVIERRSC